MFRYFFYKKLFALACFFSSALIFSSCGLESLYYLEAPYSSREVINNEDRVRDVFSFMTGDNSDLGNDYIFLGTQVYYKIFSDGNEAARSWQSISSYNSSSDISAAASYIINTKKYVPLNTEETSENTFIDNKNRVPVEIRLNRYDSYPNGIVISGSRRFTPRRRNVGGAKKVGFEFSKIKDTTNNPIPKKTDGDVDSNFADGKDEWFVDVWAFSVGRDNTYTYSYSKSLHLGCIKIKASDYD